MISSGEIDFAGFWQRIRIRLHLLMCRHCRTYAEQIHALGAAVRGAWTVSFEDAATLEKMERRILERWQKRWERESS